MAYNNNHFILAGDIEGGLTIARVDGQNVIISYQAVFLDKKSPLVKIVVRPNGLFYTVGGDAIRYW